MGRSVTRLVGSLLPPRLYHRLVVGLARLPFAPAGVLRHSVVFRHPLHPRGRHYVLVPASYASGILDLPEPTALCLQEDIMEWADLSGWRHVLIAANFGAFQETPFLHVHLMRSPEAPADGSPAADWLVVDLDDGGGVAVSGRRVVRYSALDGTANITTEVNRA